MPSGERNDRPRLFSGVQWLVMTGDPGLGGTVWTKSPVCVQSPSVCENSCSNAPPPQKKPREVLRAHAVSLRDVYTFALIPGATRCPWERGGVQLVTSMLHVPAEQVLEKEQSSIRLSLSASRRGRGSPHPHPHRVPGLQFSQSGESHRVEFATAERRQQPTCASAGGRTNGTRSSRAGPEQRPAFRARELRRTVPGRAPVGGSTRSPGRPRSYRRRVWGCRGPAARPGCSRGTGFQLVETERLAAQWRACRTVRLVLPA